MRASPLFPRTAEAPAGQWLLVNGLGCIASGTAAGGRVHPGLAALGLPGPSGVHAHALRSLDTRAIVESRTYALDPLETDAVVHSVSRAEIESFTPEPAWVYRAGASRVSRRLFLLHDQAALVAVLSHVDGPEFRVVVAPIFAPAPRDSGDEAASPLTQSIPGRLRVTSAAGGLTVWHDGAFLPTRAWQAAEAAEAPVPGTVAGFIEATLGPGGCLHIVIAADEALLRRLAEAGRLGTPPPRTLRGCVETIEAGERAVREAARRRDLAGARETAREARTARNAEPSTATSPLADDDPWVPRFARALEWDARLPGVPARGSEATRLLRQVRALVTLRRHEAARATLLEYGQLVRDGLVPSSLAGGTPHYDDPEPSLWLVLATELFARRTGELEFVGKALFPALEQVIDRFRAGTSLGIRLGDDGLLQSGQSVKGGEHGAIARADLNALWYSAQAALGQLAKALGNRQSGAFYVAWAREHQARVIEHLWDESLGTLHASVNGSGRVGEPSPAITLAASLSPSLLPAEQARRMLATIERTLLTPAGLREAPGSKRVLTEWMGPFLSAWIRAHGRDADAQRQAAGWARRFEHVIDQTSAGCVPEAFELGDDEQAPPRPDGRPISVVATAEMARFWVEELDPEFREGAGEEA